LLGASLEVEQTILEIKKTSNARRDKTTRVSTSQDVLKKNLRWKNASLANKQKWDGREPNLVQLPVQGKYEEKNKIKMMGVMMKIISPGKTERARPRAKVHIVVGSVGDLVELSANPTGVAMRIKLELICLKSKISRWFRIGAMEIIPVITSCEDGDNIYGRLAEATIYFFNDPRSCILASSRFL